MILSLLAGCGARKEYAPEADYTAMSASDGDSGTPPAAAPAPPPAPEPAPDYTAFGASSSGDPDEESYYEPAEGYSESEKVYMDSIGTDAKFDSPDSTDSVIPPSQQEIDRLRAGLLTAGEWNDNENHSFILNLMQTNTDFRTFENMWRYNLQNQVKVIVTDNGAPVNNATAELVDENGKTIYSARTNNNGVAYLYNNLKAAGQNSVAYVKASKAGSDTKEFDPYTSVYELSLPDQATAKSLDLMFVMDTTGSMSDELEYLKAELEDIIRQVDRNNAGMNIRLSINVYRDVGDEYVVRPTPFTDNISEQISFLRRQSADGGGDWEESVEKALADALEQHDWNDSATAKLMFLVLDAPPHNTDKIRDEMHRLTAVASGMGVRIIPVASSGIDKVTEFLLRALSMATGGTYVFLTDHSGIGGTHIEPTIGEYKVEQLNELLIRLIDGYLL